MKIEVAKQDLEAVFAVVASSLEASGKGISSHFLFRRREEDSSKVEVLSYSNSVFSLCPLTARVSDSDFQEFTVEGKSLKGMVSCMADDKALTIEFDGSQVSVQSSEGIATLPTKDPVKWLRWDKSFKEAKHTVTMPAARLAEALKYASKFTADDNSKNLGLCLCEAMEGIIYATDKMSAAMLTVEGLDKSAMRIHSKDMSNILGFLSSIKDDVEILEHEKAVFFRRGDGAIYGETRFDAVIPKFKRPSDQDHYTWTVRKKDLERGIQFLAFAAEEKDDRLHFDRPDSDGPVKMSMLSKTKTMASWDIEVLASESQDDAPPFPDKGFVVSPFNLVEVLKLWKEDEATFGLNVRFDKDGNYKGGYIRFVSKKYTDDKGEGGDEYLSIVAWHAEKK